MQNRRIRITGHTKMGPPRGPRISERDRRRPASSLDVGLTPAKDYPWLVLGTIVDSLTEWVPEGDSSLVRGIIRSRDWEAYHHLGDLWGLQSINSAGKSYELETACKLLLCSVIRKYPFSNTDSKKRDAALDLVRVTDNQCSEFNRSGYKSLYIDGHPTYELSLMRQFVEKVIGLQPPEGGSLTVRSRHGPGSDTASTCGHNSKYDKYREWPYRVSKGARNLAIQLIREDERWLGALEDSYRRKNHIPMWAILDWDVFWGSVFLVEEHNRVSTVPKDGRKDRPIAIEPRMNQMLQLGVDGFVRKRLKRFGIDLDSQVRNQRLAREGSLRKDADSPATLDLSNASDTVSLRLVKELFPADWFRYLCAIRTPRGVFPNGDKLRYSKLSSMGNGFTFAIETLVFGAIAYAGVVTTYGKYATANVSLYGDDIVVPSAAAPCIINLLGLCGLSVNLTKTFILGRVRESCGTDWVEGVNVRPISLEDQPDTVDILLAHRNLLVRWFVLTVGTEPEGLKSLYLKWIPAAFQLYGPRSDEEFSSYLHTGSNLGGQFLHWSWHFTCLSCWPIKRQGPDFLFRKLMHALSPASEPEPFRHKHLLKKKVSSGGSRFTVTSRDRVAYSLCPRTSPVWQDAYYEALV